ncbi:MAG TPA: LuxR C-terminal-related transcriptional regulator [Solirubrobacteraceae bacterium]
MPRVRPRMIERPRIFSGLAGEGGSALTLVAAPAGYGKTSAVRAWCAVEGARVAWVTLDVGDNDPAVLWRYIGVAVNRAEGGHLDPSLGGFGARSGPIEDTIDETTNQVMRVGERLVLVLDEMQHVTGRASLGSLEYLIRHLPPNARVVLLTRVDPNLPLSQLRASGALAELRADELAFTVDEAYELLVGRYRIALERSDVELLHARTEGWPAAFVLAALWLGSIEDPSRSVRVFGGDHRFLVDYLSREVLGLLNADQRLFLLRTSVLGNFTAELCNDVLERSDSESMLAELERFNLFVIRLGHGGWFRLHPLLAEFARVQLSSEEEVDLHRRAADWLREAGRPVEAAAHASATGDDDLVTEIVTESHLAMIRGGGARTLLQFVQTRSDEQLCEHPELLVSAATAAVMLGNRTIERRRLLKLADRAKERFANRFRPYLGAVAATVRAAAVDGGVGQAVLQGREAVNLADEYAEDLLVSALAAYARALYLADDCDGAWLAAMRAVEYPDAEQRIPGHVLARSTLALVAADRNWHESARIHASKTKAIVGAMGNSRSWLGANAAVAQACVLECEHNLADAERELIHAEHFFADEVATVHHAWLLVLLARVRCRRGRLDGAQTTLHSAWEAIAQQTDTGKVPVLAAAVDGELERARERANTGEILNLPSDAELAVLRLLSTDLSTREIGEKLFVSPNTVRSHTRALYRKLGVNSRSDAVARADALELC